MDGTHTLFSLRPINSAAFQVLNHPWNADLVSDIMLDNAINIGHFKSNASHKNECCIATLGPDPNADIFVPGDGTTASNLQYEFLIFDGTRIEFVDKSSVVSCPVRGGENGEETYLSGNSRRTYSNGQLCRIEFKVDQSNWAEFDIIWGLQFGTSLPSALEARRNAVLPRRRRKMADTQVLPATNPKPESQQLPPDTAGTSSVNGASFQYRRRLLGHGSSGAVYIARNRQTKQLCAVKERRYTKQTRREIEDWKSLGHHANLVNFQGHKIYKKTGRVHIFMDLMKGSLHDMVEKKNCPVQLDENQLAKVMYHHVLMGLDFIHSKGFIHRDLKPANILWTLKDGELSFCIADFGFCDSKSQVNTVRDSLKFMAPEFRFDYPQTTAMDLWSLFTTLLWTANLEGFRDQGWTHYGEMLVWVASLARRRWEDMGFVQELVVLDPKDRATASQMLVKNFEGKGLTTRPQDVPRLPKVTAPEEILKEVTGETIWLYQLVRPGDMPGGEFIDENAPGIHIFERPVLWPANKDEANVQVDDEELGGGSGIVGAPKRKVSKDYPRSPVAKQPWVTRQRALATKTLAIRGAGIRGIRCRA
ncbi:hypothetical protein MY5147_003310 [Beauveria neobassiana]